MSGTIAGWVRNRRVWRLSVLVLLELPAVLRTGMPGCMGEARFSLTEGQKQALARISAQSLRGHLSFIASDALRGRDTPSQGLDIAAEYIAAQFRRAGLEAVGNDGYLQTAPGIIATPNPRGFRFTLAVAGQSFAVSAARFTMNSVEGVRIDSAPVIKIPFGERPASDVKTLDGKVVLSEFPEIPKNRDQAGEVLKRRQEFINRLIALKALALLVVNRQEKGTDYFTSRALKAPPPMAQVRGWPRIRITTVGIQCFRWKKLLQM